MSDISIEKLRADVAALSSVVSAQEQMIKVLHSELHLKASTNEVLELLNIQISPYGNISPHGISSKGHDGSEIYLKNGVLGVRDSSGNSKVIINSNGTVVYGEKLNIDGNAIVKENE